MPDGQPPLPTPPSSKAPSSTPGRRSLTLTVDGVAHIVDDAGDTLLGVLRDRLGVMGAKDGCSPQGQCGCCTVLIDDQPRVACVTPARRANGKTITTIDGLPSDRLAEWGRAFCAAGGSQCGFCTPGIIVRLDALDRKGTDHGDTAAVEQALLAHLCRCTGWQTIAEAWQNFGSGQTDPARDLEAAARRATIEGGTPQQVLPEIALGRGGFAADTAPTDALIAVPDGAGDWIIGESLADAQAAAGKVQGRRTTIDHSWPLEVPDAMDGPWVATIRTTWVEPGYLETDASWCSPGGEPSSPLANGGAFGAKRSSGIAEAARRLADDADRPVLALASREHTVQHGPKRPPVAGGVRSDGTGTLRVIRTPGIVEAIHSVAPTLTVEEVDAPGPPTSADIRGAGWVEALVLLAGAKGDAGEIRSPAGATARAEIRAGEIHVSVRCGEPLDEVILRSYCIGAAHMAWSWLTSEALAVDEHGEIHDLTIRSFGILRAMDTPTIHVTIEPDDGPPVNGSDAVFAAVAAAGWIASGSRQDWPVGAII